MNFIIILASIIVFVAIWFATIDIKAELKYRNTLLKEQNKILREIKYKI